MIFWCATVHSALDGAGVVSYHHRRAHTGFFFAAVALQLREKDTHTVTLGASIFDSSAADALKLQNRRFQT